MTKIKKAILTAGVVLAIGATSVTAFAASVYTSPAEVVAGLTGKTVATVIEEKQSTGKTYGTIAKDAGKLTEFKKENIQIKKDILAKKVAAGTLTQAKADEIAKALEVNQITCDGTGTAKIGKSLGAGFGGGKNSGNGMRDGSGQGQGRGQGNGSGQGNCLN